MERFNESLPFDKRMWAEDIRVRTGRRCGGRAVPVVGGGQRVSIGLPTTGLPGPPRQLQRHPRLCLGLPCCRHVLQGSQAYAKALAKAGVLTEEEATTIVEGLAK